MVGARAEQAAQGEVDDAVVCVCGGWVHCLDHLGADLAVESRMVCAWGEVFGAVRRRIDCEERQLEDEGICCRAGALGRGWRLKSTWTEQQYIHDQAFWSHQEDYARVGFQNLPLVAWSTTSNACYARMLWHPPMDMTLCSKSRKSTNMPTHSQGCGTNHDFMHYVIDSVPRAPKRLKLLC